MKMMKFALGALLFSFVTAGPAFAASFSSGFQCVLRANADRGIPQDLRVTVAPAAGGTFNMTIAGKTVPGLVLRDTSHREAIELTLGLLQMQLAAPVAHMSVFDKTTDDLEIKLFLFLSKSGQLLSSGLIINGNGGECVP